jgi:integrase
MERRPSASSTPGPIANLRKGIAAAGLKVVEWHDLRRTCGCHLIQDRGFSLLQVSKWLGHSSVKVTEKHYAFLYVDDLEKALAKGGNARVAST